MTTKEINVISKLKEMGNYDFNSIIFSQIMGSIDFDISNKALLELDRIYLKGDYTVDQIMVVLKSLN